MWLKPALQVIAWENDHYVFPILGPTCQWTRKRKKLARKINKLMGRPYV